MKRLLLLTVALILYGSLYPWQFDWWRSSESPVDVLLRSWPAQVDRFLLRDVALNLLLYVPLGMTALLAARRHSRAAALIGAVALGAGLSFAVELTQVYVPGRVCSLLDLACNFLGTIAGAFTALLFQPRIETLIARRPHKLPMAAALLLAGWGIYQLYPFFPALNQTKLWNSLAVLERGLPLSVTPVWAAAAEWFAAAVALETVFGRLRWWALAGVMSVLAMRMLTAGRTLALYEPAGAALALALWIAIPQGRKLPVALWSMALALVLRELSPFHLSAAARPFTWIPFQPTLDLEPLSGVVILSRKAFDYGALVWLARKSGARYWQAGLATAAALFAFERVQVYLPGRTPEITDPVLAIVMTAALWMADAGWPHSARRATAAPPGHPSSRI